MAVNFYKLRSRRIKYSAWLISLVPFVRYVGLNGSLVTGNEKSSSDIDFLIIAEEGKLYTTRFLVSLIIQMTGWRRHGKNVANRICLNCYLNNTQPLIIPKRKDSYQKVANSCLNMIDLVDAGFERTDFDEINTWIKKYANIRNKSSSYVPKKVIKPKNIGEKALKGKLGEKIEKYLSKYQIKRILTGVNKDDETIATEKAIKLHPKKF